MVNKPYTVITTFCTQTDVTNIKFVIIMDTNPFRKNPSIKVPREVEDWGKTKFKPKKFGNGGNKNFKKQFTNSDGNKPFNRKFSNKNGKDFHKNKKEMYKFNEVARDAKVENSTPWNRLKNDLVFKQHEEEQSAIEANMESSQAKIVLKQREINYRKSMIEQKKQEPTQWEDFGDEEKCLQNEKIPQQLGKSDVKHNKKGKNKKLSAESKGQFRKKLPGKTKYQSAGKEFISKELLNNFDSKELSYHQNDKIRGAITKTAILAAGEHSLENVVKNMRRRKLKKEKCDKLQL